MHTAPSGEAGRALEATLPLVCALRGMVARAHTPAVAIRGLRQSQLAPWIRCERAELESYAEHETVTGEPSSREGGRGVSGGIRSRIDCGPSSREGGRGESWRVEMTRQRRS